jgi:hypothetical protein
LTWQGSKARLAQIATEDERAARSQEPEMHNWYAIESEAEFRRQEWEREVARETQAALASVEGVKPRWLQLPKVSLFGAKKLTMPKVSLFAPFASRQAAAACETYPTIQTS